jgi:hypothetical protein
MLVIKVSSLLATMCQNMVGRRAAPRKRELYTTSAILRSARAGAGYRVVLQVRPDQQDSPGGLIR